MRNIKLTIQYDGGRYRGWQRLLGTADTIQDKIEAVLSTLIGESVHIVGSGRTDAGVHAENQVANFLTDSPLSCAAIQAHCHAYLPRDIVVKKVCEAAEPFHARYNAKKKIYAYTIDNAPFHDAFRRKYSFHVPEPLDVQAMREAAAVFVGEHDFRSFTKLHSKTKSTVRKIDRIDIEKESPFIVIKISGDGFLYKMIRLIVGALIAAGGHKMTVAEIKAILGKKDKINPIHPVPAEGLCLLEVIY